MWVVRDIDGNIYHTVDYWNSTWLVENFKATHFIDGSTIPMITDNTAWTNSTTEGFCWYNNDSSTYKNPYGALYNWYAVNDRSGCPNWLACCQQMRMEHH